MWGAAGGMSRACECVYWRACVAEQQRRAGGSVGGMRRAQTLEAACTPYPRSRPLLRT